MKRSFPKPVVYVSKCLGFDGCRFNGQVLPDTFVEMINKYTRLAVVCPEVEIGLGVPRNPIRLIKGEGGELRLQQYETERDVTGVMNSYNQQFTQAVTEVDGFILKSRSPSCGISGVKIYPSLGKVSHLGTAPGLFAGAVLEAFPDVACEDEGRLTNFRIREHFLTRIFASAHWRETEAKQSMAALVEFHSRYKYLLLGYHEENLRKLGRVVANHEKLPLPQVLDAYRDLFLQAFSGLPKRSALINALYHVYGHFSDVLNDAERSFATSTIEMYREERVPLSVPLHLLYTHAMRVDDAYISSQVIFQPYPMDLVIISDSGKGRRL